MNQAKVALRTFYRDHLKLDPAWTVFDEVIVKHRETLPVVLSQQEVQDLLARLTEPRFHTYFSLLYSCGLRLGEALALEVGDISAKSLRIHIRNGKGGKDRYVPISPAMIQRLRHWWLFHRHPRLIFPTLGRAWRAHQRASKVSERQAQALAMKQAEQPMSDSTVHNALKWAVIESGINKRITPHTLRHCYATHLLDAGVSLRYISNYLGHASLNQTLVYAHLSAVGEQRTQEVLQGLDESVIRRSKG
ncbi:MAG: hypothetical protein DHS20C01_37710 [marine bacterium B5-7]|nr:MAG: hypothetical protein DHS20C01_37710 [marine bacterium B5-7]